MGKNKKNKRQNTTVYCATEGCDEAIFLEHLKSLYSDMENMRFPENPVKGGTPDKILMSAINNAHKYARAFAWFDEDTYFKDVNTIDCLGKCWCLDTRSIIGMRSEPLNSLQKTFNPRNNKKPVLIISQPICFEGFIQTVLNNKVSHERYEPAIRDKQVVDLKNSIPAELLANPIEYYATHLPKAILEQRRKYVFELDLLITMISTP